MSNIITDLLERKKGGPCDLCGHAHDVKQKCNFQHLAHVIVKLREANSFIPQILQANKEAVETAQHFQDIIRDADHAHTILMEVLSMPEYPDGELIKQRYLEELDKWQKKKLAAKARSTGQDTQEQLELSPQESSIQSEKPTTNSTSLESGSDSPKSSCSTTPNATSVDQSQK